MNDITEDIINEVRRMRDAGQKEYAHDTDNVFANFDRVSNLLDVDRKKVLMTYMLKHVDGIAAYINGHKSQRENVTGRITDCIVYLTLLWGMIEDDKVHRKESHPSMHHVWNRIESEGGGIHTSTGRILGDRLSPDDIVSEMREERARLKEQDREVGEPT